MTTALHISITPKAETLVQVMSANQKRRIGIFGGTFNPIHQGHLVVANQALQQLELDEIWFMPNNIPPHKRVKQMATNQQRVEMLQRAIYNNPRFKIELIELERGGISYTFETMQQLKYLCPDDDFYLIIGGDEVRDLKNWFMIDELKKLVTFVAVARHGIDQISDYPVQWIEMPALEISSTKIRADLAQHKSVRYLLPDEVLKYINKEGLYRD